jgi:hypothetical protein
MQSSLLIVGLLSADVSHTAYPLDHPGAPGYLVFVLGV